MDRTGPPVGPPSERQVRRDHAVLADDRRHEELTPEAVLQIERVPGRVVGKLHHHRPHERHAVSVRLPSVAYEVRHEPAPKERVLLEDPQRLVAVAPRLARRRAMKATERRQKAELRPADKQLWGWIAPEAA